jgi:O-acetyl-ADP-ribose deacetylase (regulator of RNase III)
LGNYSVSKMSILEVKGDIFSSTSALAHCVSVNLAMDWGISANFKHKFGGLESLRQQDPRIGRTLFLYTEEEKILITESPFKPKNVKRYIYYLVIKGKYFCKPSYINLIKCLREMRELMLQQGVKQLAMPKIGCWSDGLDWITVKDCIMEVFKESGVEITVYEKLNITH